MLLDYNQLGSHDDSTLEWLSSLSTDKGSPQTVYGFLFVVCYMFVEELLVVAQWEVMGDVGSVRYEPTLLLPCPTMRPYMYIPHPLPLCCIILFKSVVVHQLS